ncbi:MAG: hypothetical protein IMF11_05060 [Proteobacteria bacterium]|nr:hypothetical protein [Pseudomonadota bacterium]
MKKRWLNLMLLILCFWPIVIHKAIPQAKLIPINEKPIEVNATIQEKLRAADKTMNRMCHIAADFGFDAAEKGTSREDMHKELRETLK